MRCGSGSISKMLPAVEPALHRLPPVPPSRAAWGLRSLSRLLSCIRIDEVLVLQGSPLLGGVFSMGRLTGERVEDLAIFAAGSFCLSAHVFALNDWAGMGADLRDTNRTSSVFMNNGIGHTGMRSLWMALLALSLLLFSL